MVQERFCNDSSEAVIQNVLSQEMRSEPLCALTEKMVWRNFPKVPQTYLLLLNDGTLTVERQKALASNLHIDDFVEIANDHLVMLSHPQKFAQALNTISQRHLG